MGDKGGYRAVFRGSGSTHIRGEQPIAFHDQTERVTAMTSANRGRWRRSIFRMSREEALEKEREDFDRFLASGHADPAVQGPLEVCRNTFQEHNTRFFAGLLSPAHFTLGATDSRDWVKCSPVTDWGASFQITINRNLVLGGRSLVREPFPALGNRRFLEDLVLHGMVHQWACEHLKGGEAACRLHGKPFTDKANEIGAALNLGAVQIRHRPGHADLPVSAYWPHNVRGTDYYAPAMAYNPLTYGQHWGNAPRHQTILELFLWYLERNRGEELAWLLRDLLARNRTPVKAAPHAVERGEVDLDGHPIPAIEVLPAWLAWNDHLPLRMTEVIHRFGEYETLPILGDALEEAGCNNEYLLAHCRIEARHSRRCWVVRLLREAAKALTEDGPTIQSPQQNHEEES